MSILPPAQNVVSFANARFTLLSERLIRCEWASGFSFPTSETECAYFFRARGRWGSKVVRRARAVPSEPAWAAA